MFEDTRETPFVLAEPEYFTSVRSALETLGFLFLHQYQVDTTIAQFHVEVEYARSTSMFFHLSDHALLLKADHVEHLWGDKSHGTYWAIKHWSELNGLRGSESHWFMKDVLRHNFNGFVGCNGSIHLGKVPTSFETEWNFRGKKEPYRLTPGQVQGGMGAVKKYFLPRLTPRFTRLSTLWFSEGFTFPGSESHFWNQFPWGKFEPLAYEPLKRTDVNATRYLPRKSVRV